MDLLLVFIDLFRTKSVVHSLLLKTRFYDRNLYICTI